MELIAKIDLFDTVEFPDCKRKFVGYDPDGMMRFQQPNVEKYIFLEQVRYQKLLSLGEIRLHRTIHHPKSSSKRPMDKVVIDPNVSLKKLAVAKALLFYIRQHDRLAVPPTGEKGLQRLITTHRATAHKMGHVESISARQLMRGLEKGTPSNRNLAPLISQQGDGPRKVLTTEIERAYEVASDYFYSNRCANYKDSFSIFCGKIQELRDAGYLYRNKLIEIPKRQTTLVRYILSQRNLENLTTKTTREEAEQLIKGSKPFMISETPFEYVIIDHTVCDVMAIDDTTGLPLGRPILALALELSSRCPVGFHISFEMPSISSLLTLIKKISVCKDSLDDLRIEGQTHSLSFGKPGTILIDRGLENLSDALADTCGELGIDVDFCPRKNGRAKSPGERMFKHLNDAVFHALPGAVAHGPTEMRRLQLDPTASATMILPDIIAAVYNTLVEYQLGWHRGIKGIPSQKLQKGFEKHGQPLFDDIRVLDNHIGDTKEVRLWHYGFDLKGERFVNPNGTTEIRNTELGRQMAAGTVKPSTRQQSVRVKVKYNPADCSVAYVHFKRGSVWDYVPFHNANKDNPPGYSFKLSRDVRQFARDNGYAFENSADRVRVRARMAEYIQSLFKRKKATRAEKRAMAALFALQESSDDDDSLGEEGAGSTAGPPPFAKSMTTPSATRVDSVNREKGIRRGATKAAATRKRNLKIVALEDAKHAEMLDLPATRQITQGEEDQLDFKFSSLGKL